METVDPNCVTYCDCASWENFGALLVMILRQYLCFRTQ